MLVVRVASAFLLILQFLSGQGKIIEIEKSNYKFDSYEKIFETFFKIYPQVNILAPFGKGLNVMDDLVTNIMYRNRSVLFTLNACDLRVNMNIILINSLAYFRKVSRAPAINSKSVNLIILLERRRFSLKSIFDTFHEKKIFDVYIVYKSEGSTIVATIKPFSESNCHHSSSVYIRNYTINVDNPSNFLLTTKNLSNFFGCTIRFGVYLVKPSIICKDPPCQLDDLKGRDSNLLTALSESLNFTIQFNRFEENELNLATSSLRNKDSDILLGDFYLRLDRVPTSDYSIPYFTTEVGLVIPHGSPFTSIERLIFSFQPAVWLSLAGIISIAVFIICVVKLQCREVKAFILGSNNRNPIFNLVEALLGMSQSRLPGRNFARFLLMSFVMFCLVIRSLYQGVAFKFLTTNMSHKPFQTIDEVLTQGLTIYIPNGAVNPFAGENLKKSQIKYIELPEYTRIFELLKDPTFNGAFVRSVSIIKYYDSLNSSNYIHKICKERIMNVPVVLYFQKGSVLTETFNEKLGQLINAGLIEYWHKQDLPEKSELSDSAPKPLKLLYLLGIFQIFSIGCALSILTFIFENVRERFSRRF